MATRETTKKKPTEFTVPALSLRAALTTALPFVCTYDPESSPLAGVNVRPHGDGIEVAATDRYCLYWEELPTTGTPFEALIPTAIVKRLLEVMPKDARRKRLTGLVTFTLAGQKVTARYVADGFEAAVTWTVPKRNPEGAVFPPLRKLVDSLENADPVHAPVHLNAGFLARITRALATRDAYGPVEVTFVAPGKPVRLRTEDGSATALIMPVRKPPESAS